VTDFVSLLSAIEEFRGQENQSATITANSRVSFQVGHFGLGANAFLNITADPNFDFDNLGPDNTPAFTVTDFTNPSNLGCATCGTGAIALSGNGLDATQATAIDTQLQGLGWTAAQRNGFINSVDNGLSQAGVTVPDDIVTQTVNAATLADTAAAGSGGPLSQNKSTLHFKGIALAEIPLTYGHAVSDKFSIGGNLKYMKARVYDQNVEILRQDFGDALDDALDNYTEESAFGVDLGLLYHLGDSFRIGLVGRNLNAPEFGSIQEDAQVRTGIAFQPSPRLTFAADVDLTKNDASAGSDLKSQNVGAGLELDFIFLQLRGGIYQNLAEDDIGLVYTAGLGVNLWLINIDIGAAVSKDKSTIDDNDIWEEAKAAFSLSMLF
ncbi:MAG: conjugal transfer protein TraF, partial [Nitrospiria bacterium]